MPKPIRAFIAIHVLAPRSLRELLNRITTLGRALKAVDPENLHVTLKFLGDTDPAALPEISRIVAAAACGAAPFELRIAGLGAFPDLRRPKVVWAGLDNSGALVSIARELQTQLEPLGFPREQRALSPHLTLARVRSRPPDELAALMLEHTKTGFGTAWVESVQVYQSELGPQGPKYTPLFGAELAGESSSH